ncbi:MAG: hypothetical protein FGM15_10930 [Chthoniobacterales bacterium]|nr:hypothetical protein [Chthoniobacterales bacterium]
MKSRATARFWKLYEALPLEVQALSTKTYRLWRDNPQHPSLHFKQLSGRGGRFSVRIGIHYRAVGWKPEPSAIEWVWIGSHAEYDKLLS